MMKFNKNNLWHNAKDYFFIILGITLYGFGFSAFIAPEEVITGGMAGLGQVVYYGSLKLFSFGIPVAVTMYAVNLLLLLFAYRIVGKKFVIGTIFGVTIVSLVIGIMQPLFHEAIVKNDTFMNVVLGSILCGIGLGTTFVHNGSTGGTDIVAAIVAKRSNVSMGRTMLCVDFCIVSSSLLIFGFESGAEKLVYSFVVLIIVSTMADRVINSNRQSVQFLIISPHWEEIATAINKDAHRGCTILDGTGWYSKHDVKIVLVICRKLESPKISRIIKSIDKNAFLTQANVNGAFGQGFDELKVKIKEPPVRQPQRRESLFTDDKTISSGHPESMA